MSELQRKDYKVVCISGDTSECHGGVRSKKLGLDYKLFVAHCLIFENEATSTDNQNSKFECIHHFPQIFLLFQIAHLVECEGLV